MSPCHRKMDLVLTKKVIICQDSIKPCPCNVPKHSNWKLLVLKLSFAAGYSLSMEGRFKALMAS